MTVSTSDDARAAVTSRVISLRPSWGPILIGLVVAVAPPTGCATSASGTATPSVADHRQAPPQAHKVPSSGQAPKVQKPLDPTAMVGSPCTSLTMANVRNIGIGSAMAKTDKDTLGSGCTWAGESDGILNINWETINKRGLGDLYSNQSSFAYWISTTLGGYPGVYADPTSDERAAGDCLLNVGVNARLTFFIEYSDPLEPDLGCQTAATAAADVITNLKAARVMALMTPQVTRANFHTLARRTRGFALAQPRAHDLYDCYQGVRARSLWKLANGIQSGWRTDAADAAGPRLPPLAVNLFRCRNNSPNRPRSDLASGREIPYRGDRVGLILHIRSQFTSGAS